MLGPNEPHRNRHPNIKVLNVSIDREAFELLKEFAPTKRGYGTYIERLIFMDLARRQEREKIAASIARDSGER